MTVIATTIDEVSVLIRDGGTFDLRRDQGSRYDLELHRAPVDLFEKRVRLVGTLVGADLVNARGIAPASGMTESKDLDRLHLGKIGRNRSGCFRARGGNNALSFI